MFEEKSYKILRRDVIDGEEYIVISIDDFRDMFEQIAQIEGTIKDANVLKLMKDFDKYNRIKRKRIREKRLKKVVCEMYSIIIEKAEGKTLENHKAVEERYKIAKEKYKASVKEIREASARGEERRDNEYENI